jgi:hypothetical protein
MSSSEAPPKKNYGQTIALNRSLLLLPTLGSTLDIIINLCLDLLINFFEELDDIGSKLNKWYFVNVERGNIADKLQPRNINVSFTNNCNVPIDVIIYTFYSDQLTIDVETGIVTK